MAEQIFFEQDKIKITSSRAIFGGSTYVINATASVRNYELKPERTWPIVLMIAGLFCFLTTTLIGIVWWFLQKTKYAVLISSASGEICAFVTKDKSLADRVVIAINEAIVHRG
jgi:uncharacterized protein DUF6232